MDDKLINEISREIIDINENSHPYGENSIEVQLPFLNYISFHRKFTVVLISMALQDFETSLKVGEILADVIKKDSRKISFTATVEHSYETEEELLEAVRKHLEEVAKQVNKEYKEKGIPLTAKLIEVKLKK